LPGNLRIGLVGPMGLIPGVGDWLGSAASSYIIIRAAQLGASTGTLALMVFAVLLEVMVGVIPVVGDLFESVWKANSKNVRLLERQGQRPPAASSTRARLAGAMIVLLLLLLAGLVAATWLAIEDLKYLIGVAT
jgi:hypothetical protein